MHKHTNRLITETSPYLLQHAHNPVDWYPWSNEAFELAKAQDKPVLISIGYAACHWCHVMERESFENEETAALMNKLFINIKIDREERPDIDHIYMDAVQAMSGSGGWPLNVFLTPDKKPFYGGTYFPPVKAFNRSSWSEVITAVDNAYKEKRDEIESQANNLTERLKNSGSFKIGKEENVNIFDEGALNELAANLLKTADTTWGGFGAAPKFPQTFSIHFLLRHYHFSKDEAALKQALLSLDKMIYGGIYDQIGGGFARYSTDEKWLAPHFEKMLYDNALLISVLAEAYQLTHNELYSKTIHQTMEFIRREMMNEEGGFYSALDADSEGVEGKFYTWSKDEVESIAGDDAEIFCSFYDVTENGNWEHTNILWLKNPLEVFARENTLNPEDFSMQMEACKQRLFEEREKRIRPLLDDKIILSWNALMNIACCKAYAATGKATYKEMAVRNIAFLETAFSDSASKNWSHTFKNGIAKYPAFLDDYAYLISAYIHLQEITGNEKYLLKAKSLADVVIEDFSEDGSGFFYFTQTQQEDVIVRTKEMYDGATPSGNSTMAFNLYYLGKIFDKTQWLNRSRKMCEELRGIIKPYPSSFGNWAAMVQWFTYSVPEIVVTGYSSLKTLEKILSEYIPFKILQSGLASSKDFPLLQGKRFDTESFIYVCRNYSCDAPLREVAELKDVLK